MIIWEEILHPIFPPLSYNSSLIDALTHIQSQQLSLSLVCQGGAIVGYVDLESLLEQLIANNELQETIHYKKDILKVPINLPVEFFHNISLFLGVNEEGKVVGYCKAKEAQNQINNIRLQQMNHILNSAGVGIITTNRDFEITFVNEPAESILGLSSTILLTRNYKQLIHTNRDLEEVIQGKSLVSVESTVNFKKMSGNFSPLYYQGEIIGMIHVFFLKEKFEQAIQELEFVRNLLEDLEAVHSLSNEQITVVNPEGDIIRIAGTFLRQFWLLEDEQSLIGMNMYKLEKQGIISPSLFQHCLDKMKRVAMVQEHVHGGKVWSLATPIFYEGTLEKVIIVSREITDVKEIRRSLMESLSEDDDDFIQDDPMQDELFRKIVYCSKIMEDLVEEIKQIANVYATVILRGESGVGKEVFAHAIHNYSHRQEGPFIKVNCGAIPDNLIESELFGYERGAFTGADQRGKPGLFELAQKGTIFLDEISELPLHLQVKLLRVLQEKEIMRIGGIRTTPVDVRVIAATNKDLRELIAQNKFREDLYYRLHVLPIEIPPLRERSEDIASLSFHFMQQFNKIYRKEKSLSLEAIQVLESYEWPGNVRELQNVIERLHVTSKQSLISPERVLTVLYKDAKEKSAQLLVKGIMPLKKAIEEVEAQLIQLALKKYKTATRASEVLGISKATISRRINKILNQSEGEDDVYFK